MLNSQSAPRFPRSVAGERFVPGAGTANPDPLSLVRRRFGLQDKSDALRREERRPGGDCSSPQGAPRFPHWSVRARPQLVHGKQCVSLPGDLLRNGVTPDSKRPRRREPLIPGPSEPSPANRETAREIGCAQAKLESVAGAYTCLAWSRDRGDHGWIHCLGERCRSITVEDLLRRDGVTESAAEGAV